MKTAIALLPLSVAALLAVACSSGPRPLMDEPEVTIDTMRAAYDENDVGLFLHTLGRPVLKVHSEQMIRIGWSEVREPLGEFVKSAKLVEVSDYPREQPDVLAPAEFVWPLKDARLKRVRLTVDGASEDFLFEREVDPPAEDSKQARGFWIGDRYFVRTEHISPDTYLVEDSPEESRTHWRLVFPYYPFQRQGELTRKLQDKMAAGG
jgi:hypothetical protein